MHEHMTDYTAHVQLPDAVLGTMFHIMLLKSDAVTFSALRVGTDTWLSFGVTASSDDDATMIISNVIHTVSHMTPVHIPAGYDESVTHLFETAPLIVTAGRTVVHSQGV